MVSAYHYKCMQMVQFVMACRHILNKNTVRSIHRLGIKSAEKYKYGIKRNMLKSYIKMGILQKLAVFNH